MRPRVTNQDTALRLELRKRERREVAHDFPVRLLQSSQPQLTLAIHPQVKYSLAQAPEELPAALLPPVQRLQSCGRLLG